ncbi:MAG: hypothetical protein IJV16_04050 [Lachnospiraceae bacterium]|nr:hypothetical protein [Lachnospiraceae bacterium]
MEDTGPGFDPSDESKPHTALENIRQRLDMMCGGSMTIKPREGGGTVVTITIPDSNEMEELQETKCRNQEGLFSPISSIYPAVAEKSVKRIVTFFG